MSFKQLLSRIEAGDETARALLREKLATLHAGMVAQQRRLTGGAAGHAGSFAASRLNLGSLAQAGAELGPAIRSNVLDGMWDALAEWLVDNQTIASNTLLLYSILGAIPGYKQLSLLSEQETLRLSWGPELRDRLAHGTTSWDLPELIALYAVEDMITAAQADLVGVVEVYSEHSTAVSELGNARCVTAFLMSSTSLTVLPAEEIFRIQSKVRPDLDGLVEYCALSEFHGIRAILAELSR